MVHCSLLRLGLVSRRPVMNSPVDPCLLPCQHQNGTMEQWKKVALSDESSLFLHVYDCVCMYLGKELVPECPMKGSDGNMGSVVLESLVRQYMCIFLWCFHLNIIADLVHLFNEVVFLFQQDHTIMVQGVHLAFKFLHLSPVGHWWSVLYQLSHPRKPRLTSLGI